MTFLLNSFAFDLGGGSSGDWSTLLHFDGSDGSTTIVDSTGNHTYTANGSAQLDTSQKKFGTASLLLDGDSDYCEAADSSDWDVFGSTTGSHTISFWIRPTDTGTGGRVICRQGENQFIDDNSWYVSQSAANIYLLLDVGGTPEISITTSGGPLAAGTWSHVAVIRVGSDVGVYVDGDQLAYDGSWTTDTFAAAFSIGYNSTTCFDGHIDDFALSNDNYFSASPNSGFTDTITVPTAPFE